MAINIDNRLCKGCGLCVYYCPKGVFVIGTEVNEKGFPVASVIREKNCIKCRICENSCPDLAIFINDSAFAKP